jgi:hypothetical protein
MTKQSNSSLRRSRLNSYLEETDRSRRAPANSQLESDFAEAKF